MSDLLTGMVIVLACFVGALLLFLTLSIGIANLLSWIETKDNK